MSFNWNGRMGEVINLAKERAAALEQLKKSSVYNWNYIYQVRDQYRNEIKNMRAAVISDFTTDTNNQLASIQDKYIKEMQSSDPTAALLKITRALSVVKAMTTDELKNAGFAYKINGYLDDPEKNNMDYLNTLMGELGSRGEFGLVTDMKAAMKNTWYTDEPWKQDKNYVDLAGQLDAIKTMNQFEPDSLWLTDGGAANNYQNTHYRIDDLIA